MVLPIAVGKLLSRKAREIMTFSVSSEDLERAARRFSSDERKQLRGNFEEFLKRIGELDIRGGKRLRLERGGKEREIVVPSLESKLLQYILLERIELPKRVVSFSRPGKGRSQSNPVLLKRELGADDWLLRADIKDFFPSVPHRLLRKRIPARFEGHIMAVVKASGSEDRGIPLGTPLSNALADLYLSEADRKLGLVYNSLGCTAIRYVDDYLHAGNREGIKKLRDLIVRELKKLELEINGNKTALVTLQHGVDFLGYHLSSTVKVKKETRNKMLETLTFSYYFWNEEKFWSSVAGMHGHARWSSGPITQLTSLCAG